MLQQTIPLTFGANSVTTLTLSGSEQFCNQIGISEVPQQDLRVKYVPLITNSASVFLEIRIYLSDDGTMVEAANSSWYPFCKDKEDGSGGFDPIIKIFRNPAISTSSSKRNPSRSFPVGAKKIRFGFTEAGSPLTYGSITEGHLCSHSL